MKNKRIAEVGILNFSPNLVHTPNAYFSKKSCTALMFKFKEKIMDKKNRYVPVYYLLRLKFTLICTT